MADLFLPAAVGLSVAAAAVATMLIWPVLVELFHEIRDSVRRPAPEPEVLEAVCSHQNAPIYIRRADRLVCRGCAARFDRAGA